MTHYSTLGRSGLVVNSLSLGTMTFGTQRWGADDQQSYEIFKAYYEMGGNFIDTANVYSGGQSEKLVGQFVQEMNIRDEVVIATKAGFGTGTHPHTGGNGAKHISSALDASLKRMNTDYVDLYWVHMWDMVTPAEEMLETMASLVRAGKIRYWGISNSPAWYISKIVTLAKALGLPGPIGLQLQYSLVERNIEAEHFPLALEEDLAVQPWSPLAGGFLTGKYSQADPDNVAGKRGPALPDGAEDTGAETNRLSGNNPFGDSMFTERNWQILDVLKEIAEETGYQMAQIALNWLSRQPLRAPILIGASRKSQLDSNMAALDISLTDEQLTRLNGISRPDLEYPAALFNPEVQKFVFGGHEVTA
ncbi:aldo/keto reductase [Microbulbifer hainanensis]|uniref:aldo/keto reductase n=1 Tax=Microbulbifer hainanensis TaxID=2735675 RepID=UPI0029BFF303|nr:aldo/keto reductase [Microbulbifer hainanensis]